MKSTLFVLCIVLFSVKGDSVTGYTLRMKLPQECGRTRYDAKATRIVNGNDAQIGQFPWIARLGQKSIVNENEIFFSCGGALINRYFVLSAAHCGELSIIIRVGENYANEDMDCDQFGTCAPPHQDLRIKRQKMGDYSRRSKVNDILLIELLDPAKFNEFVQPICLPPASWSLENFVKQRFTVAGWGLTSPGVTPNKLQYIVVPVLSLEACKKVFSRITGSQFCMDYPENGQNVCQGDSGGPTHKTVEVNGVRRAYIFGIASYVKSGCKKGTVYTSVIHFRKNILDFMAGN